MTTQVEIHVELELRQSRSQPFRLSINTELELSTGILGVYGASGQGKSSLLKCLAGLNQTYQGEIYWQQRGQDKVESKVLAHNPCVYQSQDVMLFEQMTVEQNLNFVQRHSNWAKHCRVTKAQVIAWTGIASLLKQPASALSGGEKQRVGLARSLLSGKPIVLLDEPFSALDWQTRTEMLALITRLQRQMQIQFIVVSHALAELALCCQQLLHIEQGRLIRSGPIEVVLPALAISSPEPVFSRLKLISPKVMPQYHLTRWLLQGSESVHVYCKATDERDLASSTVAIVPADKVSLSKQKLTDSSMLNQMLAQVVELQSHQHLVLVTLEINGQRLQSLISALSKQNLALEVGMSIYAGFKAV